MEYMKLPAFTYTDIIHKENVLYFTLGFMCILELHMIPYSKLMIFATSR